MTTRERIQYFLVQYVRTYKKAPTLREVQTNLKIKSVSTVHYHMKKFKERSGLVTCPACKGRGILFKTKADYVTEILEIAGMT